MKRKRYVPRPLSGAVMRPFHSAEEAWFWFMRAEKARRDGRRFEASTGMARPCEADDVYLVALSLLRAGVLRALHLRTLFDFGARERVPDGRIGDEAAAARLWDEALDRMATVMRRKGILA